ncbi:MAG TPA: hypothetical protein VFU36_11845 [Jatrophihabitans sp.]|nr:hypothetical protein [Jatrophihabitans sp.]
MRSMPLRSKFLLAAALAASAVALTPAGPAAGTAIPDPSTQYRLDSYHDGSINGEVIGQYAYAGPCGDAFWWGQTSQYVTTTWVTCPGN